VISALLDTVTTIGLPQMLAIWGALVFASLIRAFTGFGFALAAMPVLSLFVIPAEAVVLTAALTLGVTTLTLPSFWRDAPKRPLLPVVLLSVVGTALGVRLLAGLSAQQFQFWIGLSVIAACLGLTFFRPGSRPLWPGLGWLAGLASGLMNGAFAIPGPPVIIYAMATQRDPVRSRAMLILFFMLSAAIALVNFALAGMVSAYSLWLFVLAMPAMLLGDAAGRYLFGRFGSALYRRAALLMLYLLGLSIALRALLSA
jgi:uncharacterized membrane protein YfcA